MAGVLRYGFAPLLLLGVNGAAIALIGAGAPKLWLLPLLLFAVAFSFVAERLLPYAEEWNRSHDDAGRDWLHALVNESANFGTLLLLPVFVSLLALDGIWPESWPFVAQVLLAVLVADVGITLAHYASHRLELLWRFHAVHHSVKRMYGFNGLMKHPVHQAIETMVGTTPLVVMGLPPAVALALVSCVVVQLLLQHSNVDYRVGPFKTVLAVNEVHRFHHQKEPAKGDVNFGLFTTLTDRALGTFHFTPRAERFTSDEIGIGDRPDYPTGYAAQLVEPFRRRKAALSLGTAG